MDHKFNDKSYAKSKTMRKLARQGMFQRNRTTAAATCLQIYPLEMQQIIKESMYGEIPNNLSQAYDSIGRENISYYRRSNKPVFKTKANGESGHDPHMTFESLWCLAGTSDIENYVNYQKVIKQFQDNLGTYLKMPYGEIREMAIVAAGNKVLGREEDILSIVDSDEKQLWVLINHIYQRKINFNVLYRYLDRHLSIVYRTIYEMTNNQKDEIIDTIMNNEEILSNILDSFTHADLDVKLYCVRIIGNLLAEREDYNEVFRRWGLLDRLGGLLKGSGLEVRKDVFWLLSNYIGDSGAANEVMCRSYILQKMLQFYKNEASSNIRIEIYYVLNHLTHYGDNQKMYRLGVEQKILQQCSIDIEIENQELTLIILSLIYKLLLVGEEYVEEDGGDIKGNYFIWQILHSNLEMYINSKTYSPNLQISNISLDIGDMVKEHKSKYEDNDDTM